MTIRKFGLELRAIGSLDGLYKDIDLVLSKYDVQASGLNMTIQANAAAHALQKMFSVNSHFNVCCIRDCAKLCQIVISEERMDLYHTQHCMDWSSMTDEFRMILIAMVLDDFRFVLNPQDII